MTLPEILGALPRLVGEVSAEDLPALAGKLREVELLVELRLRSGPSAGEEDRLLDMPEVARVLGVPEDYAYTVARQRKIPTVRLPGLDKGGKARDGKYVRVRLSALRAWAEEHEDKGIDDAFSTVIKSSRDRQRGAEDPKGPRALSDRIRQARGRDLRDGEQVGDGGEQNPGAHGEAHQAALKAG